MARGVTSTERGSSPSSVVPVRPANQGNEAELPADPLNPGWSEASKPSDENASEPSDGLSGRGEPKPTAARPFDVAELPDPSRPSEEREKDRELVQRAQQGDRDAFRQLYERHHKRAYVVALGVLKNRQDALDVVQEAFVRVHQHLDSFQGSSGFYTWLYRIVMNLAIDQLRRRRTTRPVEYDDGQGRDCALSDDTILPRVLDSNPGTAAMRRELMKRVERALAALPEYHRQVILLRELEGLSYEEMAEILEVPKGTIMSRLFHARRKMQAALKDYVDGADLEIEE